MLFQVVTKPKRYSDRRREDRARRDQTARGLDEAQAASSSAIAEEQGNSDDKVDEVKDKMESLNFEDGGESIEKEDAKAKRERERRERRERIKNKVIQSKLAIVESAIVV